MSGRAACACVHARVRTCAYVCARITLTLICLHPGREYDMVGQCRGRLAVRPKKAHAILFYSQHPDGTVDRASKHGGVRSVWFGVRTRVCACRVGSGMVGYGRVSGCGNGVCGR